MEQNRVATDVFAWFLNVFTSVLIVFVNKKLMDPKHGYGFVFATSLCSLHFLSCALSLRTAQAFGIGSKAVMPRKDAWQFALVAGVSIATLNLSLMVNSVGFYQISKLLIIPFVCLVEFFAYSRTFTVPMIVSIGVVVTGVAIVTVTDVTVNMLGFILAMISVVTSGGQQILCGYYQKKHKMSSHQLLSNTAPLQGIMLLVAGPFIDDLISTRWILNYPVSVPSMNCLLFSCAVAVLVNLSQFMCLGRFTAVTFQVTGHAKTVLVLLVGWFFLHEEMSKRKLFGMILAVLGMISYGYVSTLAPPAAHRKGPDTPPSVSAPNSFHEDDDSETRVPLLGQKQGQAPDTPFTNKL